MLREEKMSLLLTVKRVLACVSEGEYPNLVSCQKKPAWIGYP